MPTVLQPDNHTPYEASLLTLLAGYRLLPQLRRELLIERALASIKCTPTETTAAITQFYSQHHITEETEQKAWLNHYGMTYEQLEALAIRELK